jgi:hypothetical protein
MSESGDIVIKGASVHVFFDSDSYNNNRLEDTQHHWHEGRKITRIRVFANEDEKEPPLYDSDTTDPGKYVVRVSTKPV